MGYDSGRKPLQKPGQPVLDLVAGLEDFLMAERRSAHTRGEVGDATEG
jgi:hypothetical protein